MILDIDFEMAYMPIRKVTHFRRQTAYAAEISCLFQDSTATVVLRLIMEISTKFSVRKRTSRFDIIIKIIIFAN